MHHHDDIPTPFLSSPLPSFIVGIMRTSSLRLTVASAAEGRLTVRGGCKMATQDEEAKGLDRVTDYHEESELSISSSTVDDVRLNAL